MKQSGITFNPVLLQEACSHASDWGHGMAARGGCYAGAGLDDGLAQWNVTSIYGSYVSCSMHSGGEEMHLCMSGDEVSEAAASICRAISPAEVPAFLISRCQG